MKRFKNIVAVFDLALGGDETLEKGIGLGQRNKANLTILNIMAPDSAKPEQLKERKCLMARLCGGIQLGEGELDVHVKTGPRIDEILNCAERKKADLIVVPSDFESSFAQFLGADQTAELVRRANCPVWIVKPGMERRYRRIVAAVNAGKSGALDCPANRRILEMASSLADSEHADLHLLYAWEFDQKAKDTLSSEVPMDVQLDMVQAARRGHHDKLINLAKRVLGHAFKAKPISENGKPEQVIVNYVKEWQADLLVTEGSAGNPLVTAIVGNRLLRLVNESCCSVLVSKPAPMQDFDKDQMPGEGLKAPAEPDLLQ